MSSVTEKDTATGPAGAAPSRRGLFPFVLLAALLCLGGLAYSLFGLGESLRYQDESEYLALARHLAAGLGYTLDGLTPSAYRPPGYAVALAPLSWASDSVHAVRVFHFALLALSCALLGGLVDPLGRIGRWWGACLMVGGLLAYPVLIYTAGTVFPQTLILALATLVVVLLQRPGNSLVLAALLGALAAFTAEVSPTALVLVPGALLFAAFVPHWSASRVLVMALAASLVFGVWLARNVIVMEAPVLFSTNLAENLDKVVVAADSASAGSRDTQSGAVAIALERLGQLIASPGAYLEKVAHFFAWRNRLYVATESSATRDAVMFVTYYGLLSLVALRLLLARRVALCRTEWLVLGLYLGTALFHALVFARIRYRLPFDFLLLLPAVNALLLVYGTRRGGRSISRTKTKEALAQTK